MMPPGETDQEVRLGGWRPPAGQRWLDGATRAPWRGALRSLAPLEDEDAVHCQQVAVYRVLSNNRLLREIQMLGDIGG